ncbi:MAG TPA: autotransporter domain-containing protein [Rhizomicrobium sp.]
MTNSNRRQLARVRNAFLGATALAGFAAVATPASAIVINDTLTPTQVVDTTNVTGVGQMVVDEQNGFIGLCTATLINPRVVIFASHCVNENPAGNGFMNATGYGAANGGLPIGFFFNSNNNVAGNSAIGQWLNGVGGGPRDLTRTNNFAYNSNFVVYDTNCCNIGLGNNFLKADIAMAALDTPAINVPTWTILFSALSGPAHATIVGYGDNGIGTTGQGTIDFKRRVAENIVSVLGSLDSLDESLERICVAEGFPCAVGPDGLPANLYQMDFNDPKFNTAQANQFDFNIFNDAPALTREGITAPGDSGGPLIIDTTFSSRTIAAVLSGGDRFYPAQPGSSYGTTSFYQPLYLYWDWIVANNPYKYVTNTGGDHNWTDSTAFMMALDPAQMTIDSTGHLVNALPTTAAIGTAATPGFGEVCYLDDCIDISSGTGLTAPIVSPRPGVVTPTSGNRPFNGALGQAGFDALVQSFIATSGGSDCGADIIGVTTNADGDVVATGAAAPACSGGVASSPQSNWTNPEGTAHVGGAAGPLVQGAPGASPGHLINDTNANVGTNSPARYYDVTFKAAGTTTLQAGAPITVDMLTINGLGTGLTVATGATLTTLINTNVFAGGLTVDGIYNGANGIQMFGGLLSGTGTINTPLLSFLIGAVAPGRNGTIGTLTVNGNVSLGLGSTTIVEVAGPGGTSDLLKINGNATVGGTAMIAPQSIVQQGSAFTFLTATTITGAYDAVPDTVPGVLFPSVSKTTTGAVQNEVVTFQAGSFVTVIGSGASAHQLQIAAALDADRGAHYNDMLALYQAIDPLSDGALAQALENLAPLSEEAATLVGDMQTTGYDNMLWQQLGGMGNGAAGYGQSAGLHIDSDGLKSALNSASGVSATSQQFMALGANIATNPGGGNDVIPTTGTAAAASPSAAGDSWMMLPNGAGGFISGSSLNGTVAIGGDGKADVRGLIIGAGVDIPVADGLTVGASIGFSDALATLRSAPASLQSNTFQGALYARYDFGNHYMAEAFGSYGGQSIESRRIAVVGPTSFAMMGHSSGSSPAFGASIGRSFVANTQGGMTINLIPSFGLQYTSSSIDAFTETGGPAAMTFAGFNEHSLAARIGFDANATFDLFKIHVTPNTHLFWVNSFGNNGSIQAAFAAAPSGIMTFAIAARDHSYAETGFGLDFDLGEVLGKDATLSGRYDSTLARKDIGYGAWTGRLSIKF